MSPAEGCAREVLPRGFVGHLVLRLLGARRVRVATLMIQLLFLDTLIFGRFPGVLRHRSRIIVALLVHARPL